MFSNSCKYGLRSVIYLTEVSNVEQRVRAKEIADHLEVPLPFLSKILQDLARKGIISSIKGPNGGFYMTAEEKQQKVLDIVEAIDGLNRLTECALGLPECSNENPCPLHHQIKVYRDNLHHHLADNSLLELSQHLKD